MTTKQQFFTETRTLYFARLSSENHGKEIDDEANALIKKLSGESYRFDVRDVQIVPLIEMGTTVGVLIVAKCWERE